MIYAWLDIEGVGLASPSLDHVLEMAMVLTGPDLEPLHGASLSLIIRPRVKGWQDQMSEVVRKMHTQNRLLNEIPTGMSVEDADVAFDGLIRQHTERREKVTPAGSGIDFYDLPRLRAKMPRLCRRFHSRTIDISHTRRFLRDIAGTTTAVEGRGKHRAMADVEDILAEARAMRDLLR